jgi:hypothetical protein
MKEIKASAEAQVPNALHASAADCFRYHHFSTTPFISIIIIIIIIVWYFVLPVEPRRVAHF